MSAASRWAALRAAAKVASTVALGDFTAEALDGSAATLSALLQTKPVMLQFGSFT